MTKIRWPVTRYVYDFDEPADGGRELLGGKGIGLAEMTQLGVPVPAGFTITTDACRAYLREGGLPAGLEDEVGEHIARLEAGTGKRFGDPADPLLVSVRSGAAVSMPGMMDTILNLGLNDDALAGALVLFYGLFTPFWFGLRALAWAAEFRSRRRRSD